MKDDFYIIIENEISQQTVLDALNTLSTSPFYAPEINQGPEKGDGPLLNSVSIEPVDYKYYVCAREDHLPQSLEEILKSLAKAFNMSVGTIFGEDEYDTQCIVAAPEGRVYRAQVDDDMNILFGKELKSTAAV